MIFKTQSVRKYSSNNTKLDYENKFYRENLYTLFLFCGDIEFGEQRIEIYFLPATVQKVLKTASFPECIKPNIQR